MSHSSELGPILLPDQNFIAIVNKLFTLNLPLNHASYPEALRLARQRHLQLCPNYSIDEMKEHIVDRSAAVYVTTGRSMLQSGNLPEALALSHTIYAYCLLSLEMEISPRETDLDLFHPSLDFHRRFGYILGRFVHDPFLRNNGRMILGLIGKARNMSDFPLEHILLRKLINEAALNGTLGDEARRYVDPFAIMVPEANWIN